MKTFKQPVPRVLAWVWLGVVAFNLVDLAMRGRTSAAVVAAAVLLCTAGAAYVLALRPKIVTTPLGVRVINPLRETFVPWSAFTWADVTDVLRVHAGGQVIRSWPLRETKRAHVRANLRYAEDGWGGDQQDDPRAMRPVTLMAWELRGEAERRKARPSEEAEGGGAVGTEPTVLVSPDAVVALAVPVILLVAVLFFL
ncbi:PH domain-containing protein [Nocardiopsis ansamitocini]|uniref:PH domain-containing protein n=1 Tax=Nocardiopsis ansamitocini TaxID=1670832 RepID=A0A9W6P8K3_9ACTN|nr:PH domain-containing protein [Nocardiopsis ansamitocini]GLU49570.1 hypothetical protein Nans01_39210 [Nocardiopsis ansamitocini]